MSARNPNEYDYRQYRFDVPSHGAFFIFKASARLGMSEVDYIRAAVAEKLYRDQELGDDTMSRESVLTVGNYREGLTENTASLIEQFEAKEKSGFKMFPQEEAILELARVAEGYDELAEELLSYEPKADDILEVLSAATTITVDDNVIMRPKKKTKSD